MPSLALMLRRCVATVWGEINSSSAISLLDFPAATNRMMSFSRWLRLPHVSSVDLSARLKDALLTDWSLSVFRASPLMSQRVWTQLRNATRGLSRTSLYRTEFDLVWGFLAAYSDR